jgi:hypothetical protein
LAFGSGSRLCHERIDMRGLLTKVGLLLTVALVATAAILVISAPETGVGASSQVVTWNPDNTSVSGGAQSPTLSYSGVTFTCAEGTLDGATGQDSPVIDHTAVDFFEPCTIAGEQATVDCGDGASTVNLIAQNDTAGGGTGGVELNEDFVCVVTVPELCSITVAGPQKARGGFILDEANQVLHLDAPLIASKSGSMVCGSQQEGTITWQADYEGWPATIDP